MDIGFGDIVTPAPVDLDYPALLEHLPSANILAYSLETVVAEKFHAVIDLADQSSRMKDYYDLYQILNSRKLDTNVLQEAIIKTFANRHTSYDPDTMYLGMASEQIPRWRQGGVHLSKRSRASQTFSSPR